MKPEPKRAFQSCTSRTDIAELEGKIEEARIAKEEAISHQEYEKAAKLRDNEKTLREELQKHSHRMGNPQRRTPADRR